MGSGGLVAESYAALLQKLWEEEKQTVNPKFFKKAFQGYDSQFSGVDQHDSQEFVVRFKVFSDLGETSRCSSRRFEFNQEETIYRDPCLYLVR